MASSTFDAILNRMAALEQEPLGLGPEAQRTTLTRGVSFDPTGVRPRGIMAGIYPPIHAGYPAVMAVTDPNTLDQRRSSIRWRKAALIAAVLFGGLLLFLFATARMLKSLNGPPFQLVVEQNDDHATVQFMQAQTGLISKVFPIDIDRHFEGRQVVVLDSASVIIPGGRIEFADTTLLPGRFTIRVGQTVFDVMQSGIDVDGQPFEWLHGDSLP
jgi:hypothetical protein